MDGSPKSDAASIMLMRGQGGTVQFDELMIYQIVISNGDLIDDEVEGRLRDMLINSEVKDVLKKIITPGRC